MPDKITLVSIPTYVMKLTKKEKGWNRVVMGNTVQAARGKMRWQGRGVIKGRVMVKVQNSNEKD